MIEKQDGFLHAVVFADFVWALSVHLDRFSRVVGDDVRCARVGERPDDVDDLFLDFDLSAGAFGGGCHELDLLQSTEVQGGVLVELHTAAVVDPHRGVLELCVVELRDVQKKDRVQNDAPGPFHHSTRLSSS